MIIVNVTEVSKSGFGIQLTGHQSEFKELDSFVLIFQHEGKALNVNSQLRWSHESKLGFFVKENSQA